MSKKLMLLIAEKDSECKEYRQVYEKYKAEIPYNIIFTKLRGHVDTIKDNKKENWAKHQFVLPEGFLSWNFNNNAVNDNKTSPYQVAIDGKKYVDAILNLLSKYSFDYIGIGTNGDIEGSTLASAFLSLLPTKYQQIPRLRLFIDDNSEQTILNGLKHMHHDDELMANGLVTYNNFKNSGILRNQLNYVTGISLTRALSVKANGKVKTNIGLVKAPILEIVNARYQQFINFKPQTFYYIQGNISLLNDNKLTVELFNRKTNKRFNFLNKDKGKLLIQKLPNVVLLDDIKRKNNVKPAPQFYRLTKLQGVLNKNYGMGLNKSLNIIEKLYNDKKLLTYPRTESDVVGDGQIADFPNIVKMCECIPALKPFSLLAQKLNRFDIVAKDKRFVNQKAVSAHPALTLNTHKYQSFDWNSLSEDEQHVIYEVAVNNLAPFLLPKVTENTVATFLINNNSNLAELLYWRGTQNIVKENGWTALLQTAKSSNDNENIDVFKGIQDKDLHHMNCMIAMNLHDGKTKPLPLYTIKTLMDNLDTLSNTDELLNNRDDKIILKKFNGIGTPATRGAIIEQLQQNKMIYETKKVFKEQGIGKGKLIPTKSGVIMADILADMKLLQLDDVVDMEADLINVQQASLTPQQFQDKYFNKIKQQVLQVQNNQNKAMWQDLISKSENTNFKKEVGICPLCGNKVTMDNKFVTCESSKLVLVDNNNQPTDSSNPNAHWIKVGCPFLFSLKPYHCKHKLRITDVNAIINGKNTKPYQFTSQNGKTYTASLKWDNIKQQLGLVFDNHNNENNKPIRIGICPLCGGKVFAMNNNVYCENSKLTKKDGKFLIEGCQFRFSRKPLHSSKPLTIDDIQNIINGKTTTTHTFTSYKNGKAKKYQAQLQWDNINNRLNLIFN